MAKKSTNKAATPEVVQSTSLIVNPAESSSTLINPVFSGQMNLTEKDVIDASVHMAEKALRAKIKLHGEESAAASVVRESLNQELQTAVEAWAKKGADVLIEKAMPIYAEAGYAKVNVNIRCDAVMPVDGHPQVAPCIVVYQLYGTSTENSNYGTKTVTYVNEMTIKKSCWLAEVLGARLPTLVVEYAMAVQQIKDASAGISLRRAQVSSLDQVARQAKSNFVWATMGATEAGADIMHRTQAGILAELDLS